MPQGSSAVRPTNGLYLLPLTHTAPPPPILLSHLSHHFAFMMEIQLTLNLLTTTIVAPPHNASKWQMGFNSAFKGLKPPFLNVILSFWERKKWHGTKYGEVEGGWWNDSQFVLNQKFRQRQGTVCMFIVMVEKPITQTHFQVHFCCTFSCSFCKQSVPVRPCGKYS